MSAEERPPFERTVCACSECVSCCKRQPGPLGPGDFQRIAAKLGEETAREKLWASPGAVVGKFDAAGDLKLYRIGCITPKHDATGRCVFLGADERCEIHDVSPYGCAFYDTHMGAREADRRSDWYLRRLFTDVEYGALRAGLAKSPALQQLEAEEE